MSFDEAKPPKQPKSDNSSSSNRSNLSHNNTNNSSTSKNQSSQCNNSSMTPETEWINLNVGGTTFMTTKTTLLKYSDGNDHFLAKLISDNELPSRTDQNGAYLVDRNPEFFKHVINFLRNGRLDVPADHTLEGVLSEAEFCNLRELVNLCKTRISERDFELENQRKYQLQQQKRVIYRVLQSSATELTQMISTLSESWRLEQILTLNTDATVSHGNQMNGGGGNEYLVVVSQEQNDSIEGNQQNGKSGQDGTSFSNCNDKVKALSGSLSAHTITTLYR